VRTLAVSPGAPPAPAPDDGLRTPLQAVVSTIASTLGYATVVANVYLPAFDAFEVVAIHGGEDVRRTLLGNRTAAEDWDPLFAERFRRGNAYFIPAGSYDWKDTVAYIPPGGARPDADAWQPEDGLFVALRSATGEMIGVLSVDEPLSGRRPSDGDLDVLAAVAAQAGLVIESARHAAEASRHRAEVEHLLRVSRQLTGRDSQQDVLQSVCDGIADGLGFERVAMILLDDEDLMTPAAWTGWADHEAGAWGRWPISMVEPLLDPVLAREGCVLLSREQATDLVGASAQRYSSQLNGRGPRGWNHHWLLVPLHADDDALLGFVWADESTSAPSCRTARTKAARSTSAAKPRASSRPPSSPRTLPSAAAPSR
jgi:hypothetical protein